MRFLGGGVGHKGDSHFRPQDLVHPPVDEQLVEDTEDPLMDDEEDEDSGEDEIEQSDDEDVGPGDDPVDNLNGRYAAL